MKVLTYILLFLIFASCRHPQKNIKFITTDFKYSVYIWHSSKVSNQNEFHLSDYFHIDSNGYFNLIKQNPDTLEKHFYYTGTINDSIRQIIDSILLGNKFYPAIRTDGLPDTPFIIYEGCTYLLDYKIIDKARTKIQYVNSSSRAPKNILFLTSFLDTVISKTEFNKIDSFSIDEQYIDTLKKISSYNLPPPPEPPPPIDKSIMFGRPKKKH